MDRRDRSEETRRQRRVMGRTPAAVLRGGDWTPVGRRGPVARGRPAWPTPAAPAQLTGDEAIEPAVAHDDQRAVVVGQLRERLRRDGRSSPCRRHWLVAFAAAEHLHGARDQHPGDRRKADRNGERLWKADLTQRGLDTHLLTSASRAAVSSARRESLATTQPAAAAAARRRAGGSAPSTRPDSSYPRYQRPISRPEIGRPRSAGSSGRPWRARTI